MFSTRTHAQFLEDFIERRDDADEFVFLSDYIASNAPIKVKHLVCDTVFETTPVKLTRTRSPIHCPHCLKRNTRKISEKEIETEIETYGHGEFTLVDDQAEHGLHRLTLRHDACPRHAEFQMYRNNMLTWGIRCPMCDQNKSNQDKTDEMKRKVAQRSKEKYTLLSDYNGYAESVTVKNNETLEEETLTFSGLMIRIKKEFPFKSETEGERQARIKADVHKDSHGRYVLLTDYNGYSEKVDVLDQKTGQVDSITYSSLRSRIKKNELDSSFKQ